MSGERLRDDVDGLGVLCGRAADWFSEQRGVEVPPIVIEKDFWVTEVLRALAEPRDFDPPTNKLYPVTVRAVFKGGTSLSKAYRLIERFSEDADVFLDIQPSEGSLPPNAKKAGLQPGDANVPTFVLGIARSDTLMKTVGEDVGARVDLATETWGISRQGTKRGYRYSYPRPTDAVPVSGQLKEGVILELVRMGTPSPNARHELRSMLAEFTAFTGELALGDFEELAPFEMDVLAPERTLVDKLCILHDLGCQMAEDSEAGPGYHARHFYDVYQLLSDRAVMQTLEATPGMVAAYAATAAEESIVARRPGIDRPAGGFASSPAFSEQIIGRAEAGYEEELSRLRLGKYPSLARVAEVVHSRSDWL